MDFFCRTEDGRLQVAAGDLEVDPGIAQAPIDPFDRMFGDGPSPNYAPSRRCPATAAGLGPTPAQLGWFAEISANFRA